MTDEEHLEYYKGIHYRDFLGQEYEQTLSAQDMESIYNAFTADLRDASLADSFTQDRNFKFPDRKIPGMAIMTARWDLTLYCGL